MNYDINKSHINKDGIREIDDVTVNSIAMSNITDSDIAYQRYAPWLTISSVVSMLAAFVSVCLDVPLWVYVFVATGIGLSVLAWILAKRKSNAFRKLTKERYEEC